MTFPESTKSTYRTHLRAYLSFCLAFGYSAVPASQQAVASYIALLSQSLKFQSIKQYLNIIRLLHLEAGFPNPLSDNWYLKSILTGVRRELGDSQTPKLPITPEILRSILKQLNLQAPSDALFWAATLTGFFAFLRKSNLFPPTSGFDPDKHLIRSDFAIIPNGMTVQIKWSKTIQCRQRVLQVVIPSIPGHPLCPVSAVLSAFSLSPNLPGDPAFSFRVGPVLTHISYNKFLTRLRSCLEAAGLSPSAYAGHSLRRGGASWAFKCGAPGEFIKMQGDWKSEVYHRYLELSTESKALVALHMAKNL